MSGNIIGISGKMHSGKDTLSDMIIKYAELEKGIIFEKIGFGDMVKAAALKILGLPREYFYDQKLKNTSLGEMYDNMTVREFLQKLGTNAARSVHENIWINALFSNIDTINKNYIINDIRFPNELNKMSENTTHIYRLSRCRNIVEEASVKAHLKIEQIFGKGDLYEESENGDLYYREEVQDEFNDLYEEEFGILYDIIYAESETALDSYEDSEKWTKVINNSNYSLEDLKNEAIQIVNKLN